MLANGVYEITFQSIDRIDRASAILRDGHVLGSDRWGLVFSGAYCGDEAGGRERIRLTLLVPPGGELITGFAVGSQGATVEIEGSIGKTSAGKDCAELNIVGERLVVSLDFISALPA